jgi:hypothetical protein
MIEIDKSLSHRKGDLLNYFRQRGSESLEEIRRTYGTTKVKKQASLMNNAVNDTKGVLLKTLAQKAKNENWNNEEILNCVLMITYASYIIMLEYRNEVWPYEYMTFSRRIGELWEPFCRLCFEYPLTDISLFVPPLFSEVKSKFKNEIEDYIDRLNITTEQKQELKRYYNKVWGLVTSGEIKLELDLHFKINDEKIVVDFKSGFGSNEKGNMNRLLLVASIYKNLEENYRCMILVRSEEDRNNNYFQTLKNSGIWEAFCGNEAYEKIKEHSGFDLKTWIGNNVNWDDDFKEETMRYFRENSLDQYLSW